jgi:hypothetical protein
LSPAGVFAPAFFRNLEINIPDVEALLHALFDLVMAGRDDGYITVHEVVELARKYSTSCGAVS